MLFENFDSSRKTFGTNIFQSKVSDFVVDNLNPAFSIRNYQREAQGRLVFYLNDYPERKKPCHLLFHMATGSGKTLVMAANILYLYSLGYRNFLFFVNSTNIISKTKGNFLNKLSSKYLFADKIIFGDREVKIKEVLNFSNSSDDINIVFTTIQGLHSSFTNPSEGVLTFEDFDSKKVVFISDEAHHINALTKLKRQEQQVLFSDTGNTNLKLAGLSSNEAAELRSWEGTVKNIFERNDESILLEFTATINLQDENIREKYEDKIIYRYDLRQYRLDGYSKEIEVFQADLDPLDRSLQAIVISQFRRKIAEKNKIFLKPVVLFKSKTIEASRKFEEQFHRKVRNLNSNDLKRVRTNHGTILEKAFEYFDNNKITLTNLASELKIEFETARCLSVNSKEDSEEKQLLVNSLEDKNNEIRAIFAVDMLNEGWDVLNLFDIVRLYETRDAKSNKPGQTTIREAQLIGRGARYCPFSITEADVKDKRKFDEDTTNNLRILEQLYYHTSHNPKYIQEIKAALVEVGIMASRHKDYDLKIKGDFKKTSFWQSGLIYVNRRVRDTRSEIDSLKSAGVDLHYTHNLYTGEIEEEVMLENRFELKTQSGTAGKKTIALYSLGNNVLRAAINRGEFFRFNNLRKYFPALTTIRDFLESPKYLKSVEVSISGSTNELNRLPSKQKLSIVFNILQKIAKQVEHNTNEYKGTKEFYPQKVNSIFRDKQLKLDIDSDRAKGMAETINLSNKSWFGQNEVYGTSEEKELVSFIDEATSDLSKKYTDIALLRNERFFSIYSFDDGQAFEPDFVLFLKTTIDSKALIYQTFIEPKGDLFKDSKGGFDGSKEGWKQRFLLDIETNYKINTFFENGAYRLIGLPFFNKSVVKTFEDAFKKKFLTQ